MADILKLLSSLMIISSSASFAEVIAEQTPSTKLPSPSFNHLNDLDVTREGSAKSLRVLLLPLPAFGHMNGPLALAEELILRGHNVTVFVGVNDQQDLQFKQMIESHGVNYLHFESNLYNELYGNFLKGDMFISKIYNMHHLLKNYSKKVMQHLNHSLSERVFDVVVGDVMLAPLLVCIDSSLKIPSIILSNNLDILFHLYPPWAWASMLVGPVSDDLTFSQRFTNVLEKLISPLNYYLPYEAALKHYCPLATVSDFSQAAGVKIPYILPTVIGFEYARTISPLTEYVGPLVLKSPDPLSEEIKEWLERKPDRSVVYVSMGSVLVLDKKSGEAIAKGILETGYDLLWSIRKSNQWILEGLEMGSDRVLLSEWTPQFSVLQSKAIHSVIFHGGFNGLNEALYNGIPVIGLPMTHEQAFNVARLYHNGLGVHLEIETLTSCKVKEAILSVNTGKHRQKIGNLQNMFRFAGGTKKVADLVEFYEEVGYAHLIPAHAKYKWSWVKYHNADVYVTVAALLASLVACLLACLKCICRCCSLKPKVKAD